MAFDPTTISVAVLRGGTSAEREVSLETGANCAEALREAGFVVAVHDTADLSFIDALRSAPPDVAFIALHGRGGEDGSMQGLLELLGIPYTGSGVLASALAMDKHATKGVYIRAGLAVPPDIVVTRADLADIDALCEHLTAELGEQLAVKPNSEGSSVGVTLVHQRKQLPDALRAALRFDEYALVERFVPGREIMAGVLGNAGAEIEALPLIEVEVIAGEFYDYESKYAPGGSRHLLPAPLDADTTLRCQNLAVAAHEALGCRCYSRTDIRLDDQGKPWLLETNTLPGMTSTSLLPEAAKAVGIDFPALVTRLVRDVLS